MAGGEGVVELVEYTPPGCRRLRTEPGFGLGSAAGKAGAVVRGSFPDLCVADVVVSAAFYQSLLGLERITDLGWYVELGAGDRTLLALVHADHPTVPAAAGSPARGLLVSFEVDDAAATSAAAVAMGCRFVKEPVAELGQRHFMVLDPHGTVVDVIERIPFTRVDRVRLARYRRADREARNR